MDNFSETDKWDVFKTLDRINEEFLDLKSVLFPIIDEKSKRLGDYDGHFGKPPFRKGGLLALIYAREKEIALKTARLSSAMDLNTAINKEIANLTRAHQNLLSKSAEDKKDLVLR